MSLKINLQETQKIGLFTCLKDGIIELFKNFGSFIKFLAPVLLLFLAHLMCFCPIFVSNANSRSLSFIAFLVAILGIAVFVFAFWIYLLGLASISYFAKDVFEKKSVKKLKEYIKFTGMFSKSYIIFNLWICLFMIVLFVVAKIIQHFSQTGELIFTILTLPFSFLCMLLPVFWAHEDKRFPLKSIMGAIKAIYTNFEFFIFMLISLIGGSAAFLIMLLPIKVFLSNLTLKYVNIESFIIFMNQIKDLTLDNQSDIDFVLDFTQNHLSEIYTLIGGFLFLIAAIVAIFGIINYGINFIFTRYYFELKKRIK